MCKKEAGYVLMRQQPSLTITQEEKEEIHNFSQLIRYSRTCISYFDFPDIDCGIQGSYHTNSFKFRR